MRISMGKLILDLTFPAFFCILISSCVNVRSHGFLGYAGRDFLPINNDQGTTSIEVCVSTSEYIDEGIGPDIAAALHSGKLENGILRNASIESWGPCLEIRGSVDGQ